MTDIVATRTAFVAGATDRTLAGSFGRTLLAHIVTSVHIEILAAVWVVASVLGNVFDAHLPAKGGVSLNSVTCIQTAACDLVASMAQVVFSSTHTLQYAENER